MIIRIRIRYRILNIRTRIWTDLNSSKRIRSRIRSENIRTVFTPTLGIKISFGSIDLVDDQLGDLLFDPKRMEQEEETPIPSSCSLPHILNGDLLLGSQTQPLKTYHMVSLTNPSDLVMGSSIQTSDRVAIASTGPDRSLLEFPQCHLSRKGW